MNEDYLAYYMQLITTPLGSEEVLSDFRARIAEGRITRDENTVSHLCVYFAAYDPQTQKVFMGHHKKSGLWLFNGGHIDKGEYPEEALKREMQEEWGSESVFPLPKSPFLLTVTNITRPPNFPCKVHYDIWYAIDLDLCTFHPEEAKLEKEFFTWGWFNYEEARKKITEENTLQAVEQLLQK